MALCIVNFLLHLCCVLPFCVVTFPVQVVSSFVWETAGGVDRTARETGQALMNRRKEVKPTQRSRLDRTLAKDRSQDSGRGDSDSGLSTISKSRREHWSEEAECGDILGSTDGVEMSKNRNKDRGETREDTEGVSQHAPTGAVSSVGVDVASLMQMWMEENRRRDDENRRREEEQRRRDDERREESRKKEDAWKEEMARQREDAEKREERLLGKVQAQIDAASRPTPMRSRLEPLNLPKLTADSSLDTFISTFEAQLTLAVVSKTEWKLKLIGQLDEKYRVQVSDLIENYDSTYDEMIEGLRKASGETSTSATQRFFAPEPDLIKFSDTTKALRVVGQWAERITEGLDDKKDVLAAICRARVRAWHVEPLRSFVNQREITTNTQLVNRVAEWKAETRDEIGEFLKQGPRKTNQGMGGGPPRRVGSCYLCGKSGHFARECRKTVKSSTSTSSTGATASSLEESTKVKVEARQVKCYGCGEPGHKKPDCPKKKKASVVKLGTSRILRRNELLATVGGISMPVTLDTGAEVSVLPIEAECVKRYTGETVTLGGVFENATSRQAPLAEAELCVGGEIVTTVAAMVEGQYINWEGALAFNTDDNSELELFGRLNKLRMSKYQGDRRYSPVVVTDSGDIQGAVMWADIPAEAFQQENVSESEVAQRGARLRVRKSEAEQSETSCMIPAVHADPQSEESATQTDNIVGGVTQQIPQSVEDRAEETRVGSMAENLVVDGDSYVVEEEEGVPEDGADSSEEGPSEESLGEIVNESRDELVKALHEDHSLDSLRKLADREENGYKWEDQLLVKYQLDLLGQTCKKICVPKPFRDKCMTLAHDQFGHRGKNKVAKDLARLFYWPSLWRDVAEHCRSCQKCQEFNKAKPRHNPMVEREVITIPSERVCVDIVGPLPKARGGYEYLLTAIDVATRWPEAVALKKTTAAIIVRHLKDMFSRNGFPGVVVSDNGPQFLSKIFKSFCAKNGIQHVTTSIYCPESNGVVERFHGTLKQMVAKCVQTKGSWPEVLPMCLFFIRMTPSVSSGYSPFILMHGWEPNTPSQLLYYAWAGKHLGTMSLDEWVRGNCERVQELRDRASVNYHSTSEKRKSLKDKTCHDRSFSVGQWVWYRTPGLNEVLQPAWQGPYRVKEILGGLSYKIDVDGKGKNVHIKFLKEDVGKSVKRITTVLEDDRVTDDITVTNSKVHVEQVVLDDRMKADVDEWLVEFKDVVCTEPGLTDWVELTIKTGEAEPVSQRPYNTPVALREAVGKEVDWLVQKGYIRKSESEWAAPIVTVRKPDGSIRLCIDYKRLNNVTTPAPFYMPTIEEVLEAAGTAAVISKVDLNKGYYQVHVAEEDIQKTAFVCHKGHFEFLRMPFGLKNAPAIFQKLTSRVLEPCSGFALPYIDDIVIFSSSWEEHTQHVRKVLLQLRKAGLTASPKKCTWGGKVVEFLGHKLGDGKMSIPDRRVRALRDYVRPKTKRALRTFLGVVSFYRRYINMLAEHTAALSPATGKSAPNVVDWTEDRGKAFHAICQSVCDACALEIPLPQDHYSLVTDASGFGLGAVLQVKRKDGWAAAAFFSRQTRGPERRYSASELEALAVVEAVKYFSHYLYGQEFIIFTDHKPLCSLMTSDHLNGRLKRFSTKLQPWMVKFQYLPGVENTFADALSRQDWRRAGEGDVAEKKEDETGAQRCSSLAPGDVGDQPHGNKKKEH